MSFLIDNDSIDSHIAVLNLVINKLKCDPVWSIRLLDSLASQLIIPMLRQERNSAETLDQAVEYGLNLVMRSPSAVEDWIVLAHLLAKSERLDEALAWVDHALRVSPRIADYHRLRASLLERRGSFVEALQVAKHALTLDPNSEELTSDVLRIESAYKNWLRNLRDTSNDSMRAVEAAFILVHRDSASAPDCMALAQLLAKTERLSEAIGWIDHAIKLQSDVAEYHRLRASVFERLGRYRDAYGAALKARSLERENMVLAEDARRIFKKLIISYIPVQWKAKPV